MKVIFSRIYIDKANEGSPIQDRTSLLVWYLSALKWKQLGYETILYTDERTKEAFDELGLSSCYDEVKMIKSEESDEEVIEEPFIFDWDGLAYPRAFEDIYDPIWRD